jgi:spore cortex formation protein SpoVR/YcgB (stage V sporulation)
LYQNYSLDFFIREESEEEQKERLSERPAVAEAPGPYDDLIARKKTDQPSIDYYNRKTPLEPERDVLIYIINHSPKPLREWEKDVLSVLRDQSRYFMPQRRTKIMNEGWATFWHMRIMDRLFKEGLLNQDEHGYYNLYNARVLATNPRVPNPYLVGLKIFEDVEDRWNKGRFGREWEECEDPEKKESWDLGTGQGKEKIFEVRHCYSDRFFIAETVEYFGHPLFTLLPQFSHEIFTVWCCAQQKHAPVIRITSPGYQPFLQQPINDAGHIRGSDLKRCS